MTPKDRSESIVKKFKGFEMPNEELSSIQCSIIYVSGIIEEINRVHFRFIMDDEKTRKYWEEVLMHLTNKLK